MDHWPRHTLRRPAITRVSDWWKRCEGTNVPRRCRCRKTGAYCNEKGYQRLSTTPLKPDTHEMRGGLLEAPGVAKQLHGQGFVSRNPTKRRQDDSRRVQ